MRRAVRSSRGVRLVLAIVATSLCAMPAAAHAGQAGSVSAEEGSVGAVLSYREGVGGPLPYFDLRLRIERGGVPYYDASVSSPQCGEGCEPDTVGGGAEHDGPLEVADLEGNGQPDVILGLTTGGAHCCSVVQVFSFDPGTMTYEHVEHDFGDPGALLTELEGRSEIVMKSGDDRFAYEFTPYAWSALPLQVWRFREDRFVNVTTSFPGAIALDAKRLFKGFVQAQREREGNGLIAAWAADEYELGHGSLVRGVLVREQRHDRLRSRERYGPTGAAFVRALNRFLTRTGYR